VAKKQKKESLGKKRGSVSVRFSGGAFPALGRPQGRSASSNRRRLAGSRCPVDYLVQPMSVAPLIPLRRRQAELFGEFAAPASFFADPMRLVESARFVFENHVVDHFDVVVHQMVGEIVDAVFFESA